jgi:hypothetical protein
MLAGLSIEYIRRIPPLFWAQAVSDCVIRRSSLLGAAGRCRR